SPALAERRREQRFAGSRRERTDRTTRQFGPPGQMPRVPGDRCERRVVQSDVDEVADHERCSPGGERGELVVPPPLARYAVEPVNAAAGVLDEQIAPGERRRRAGAEEISDRFGPLELTGGGVEAPYVEVAEPHVHHSVGDRRRGDPQGSSRGRVAP